MEMAYGFLNMFAKNVLLILILSNILNVDGMPFVENLFDNYCDNNMPTSRLDQKTVVITGSNSGIGEATALYFYEIGARVIMACRDEDKTTEAKKRIKQKAIDKFKKITKKVPLFGSLVYHHLDLSSLATVRTSAHILKLNIRAIDILVNNAGVFTRDKKLSVDGYEVHPAVNYLGHFLFTLLLLPIIQGSAPSRIINVASEAYRWGDKKMHLDDINQKKIKSNSIRKYSGSKLFNFLFTVELAKRLKAVNDNKVTVLAVYPGITFPKIARNMEAYKTIYEVCVKLRKFKPEVAAKTIVYCALDSECGKQNGSYYSNCKIKEQDSKVINEITSKTLWDKSCDLVKLTVDENPFKDSSDPVQLPIEKMHINSVASSSKPYNCDSEDDLETLLLGYTRD